MKRILISLAAALSAALLLSAAAEAQTPNSKLRPDETVFLYAASSEAQTVDPVYGKKTTYAGFEMKEANGLTGPETLSETGNLGNINDLARFDLYFPKKPNGQMLIVCPGGGYKYTSSWNEGLYVAKWMLERGITVAVVKYRMPNQHHRVPLTDVQNTFRYCREHAAQWKVSQIGVMGFSAGGHLAATTETMYVDAVTKPDFAVLIYPVISLEQDTHRGTHVNLIGRGEGDVLRDGKSLEQYRKELMESRDRHEKLARKYSLQRQVTASTPATFLALCTDDKTVPAINSVWMYESLIENKVPAEMYIYPAGGHGWGFTTSEFGTDKIEPYRKEFFASLDRFLAEQRAK